MTLEELRAKARWIGRQAYWSNIKRPIAEIIKDEIKNSGSKQYISLLTDVDRSLSTSASDLIDALLRAGFPSEKITIQDEHRAQIELGDSLCTISDSQNDHAFLYDNNNTRKFLDFRHTPADIVAAYLVERYCSDNWLQEETQRRLTLLEELEKREKERADLQRAFSKVKEQIRHAILATKEYARYNAKFYDAYKKYHKFVNPDIGDDILESNAQHDWEQHITWCTNEYKREKRSKAARERYTKVTRPKMLAKKQEILEQKQALLREYEEKYSVKCKFIYVHSPYDPHHRFVVPAIEGQVVSFFVPDKFERIFYDRAMELVLFLNELTTTYGKSKVQRKGSLPKEADKSLAELLEKLDIARQWQGIYNESQRHYLDGTYKDDF